MERILKEIKKRGLKIPSSFAVGGKYYKKLFILLVKPIHIRTIFNL